MAIFYIAALFLGLPLFVISVLPWAKNYRKKMYARTMLLGGPGPMQYAYCCDTPIKIWGLIKQSCTRFESWIGRITKRIRQLFVNVCAFTPIMMDNCENTAKMHIQTQFRA